MNKNIIKDVRLNPENFRIQDRLLPENVFDTRWLFRCNVKILVVTDGGGGFGKSAGFHLGQVLEIINNDPWNHINFDFTKAHRRDSSVGDVIDNFRFDSHELTQYSQIWLFGIEQKNSDLNLSDNEIKKISEFMDNGGGIFATGDHQDLGNSISARIPRVRSMRRWYYPNPGPNGEPIAPGQTGSDRHDTIVAGGNQTDAHPQPIRPKNYFRIIRRFGKIFNYVFPHPVLCGPDGVIDYLPDHMHEGSCEVPLDLNNSWTFNGQEFVEYPTKDGHQQIPEVIACATNNITSDEFGVLAAYDGHSVDVGRVVVDATWHHWFNINIMPYVNATDPTHASYTPETVPKWKEIQAYYRNVATWLAKPSIQSCIRNGGWIRTLGDSDISITYTDLDTVKDPALYFWQLGNFAKDALGRGSTQCYVLQYIIDLVYPEKIPEFLINPWQTIAANEQLENPSGFELDDLETVVLGAAIHSVMKEFRSIEKPEKLLDDNGLKFEQVMQQGSKSGLDVFKKQMEVNFKSTMNFLDKMN